MIKNSVSLHVIDISKSRYSISKLKASLLISILFFPVFKVKVNCYWPKEGSTQIGNWIIEVLSTVVYNDYTLRELKLTNSEVINI